MSECLYICIISLKEFLKKEFSHENIYFWAACERYKDTKDPATRRKLANQIYQRHLSNTAAEPVNVDSHAAGQITQELLGKAPTDLFLQVKAIFLLNLILIIVIVIIFFILLYYRNGQCTFYF